MQRTFTTNRAGTSYAVVVTLNGSEMRVYLNWRSGFGGGGRNVTLGAVSADVRQAFCVCPGYALADCLQEIGLEAGLADLIRAA